jgi:hypothetical protein
MRPLEFAPELPAELHRAHRRGGLGAAGLGALGRGEALEPDRQSTSMYCRIVSEGRGRRRGHSISKRLVQETAEPDAGLPGS